MLPDLADVAQRVVEAIKKRAQDEALAWFWLKAILIVFASALAAVAQFVAAGPTGLSAWQITGIAAAALAGIGGFLVLLREKDTGEELAAAHEALEAARTLRDALAEAIEEFEDGAEHLERLKQLYLAIRSMRSVLERARGVALTDSQLLHQILSASKRSLTIALDFSLREHWTIAIYRAEIDAATNRQVLRCVATERSIPCDISKARVWPEGIGPTGICYSTAQEVCVPDAQDEALASLIDVGSMSRDGDKSHYRSMFSAPVLVNGMGRPWGVVTATSSRPDHFEPRGEIGVRKSEAVRTLADLVALALAVQSPAPTLADPS